MVNREHMEQWINALEAYDREPALGMLVGVGLDGEARMCAVGIGLHAMNPEYLTNLCATECNWHDWLGIGALENDPYDVPLKPDDTNHVTVIRANDQGKQSPWTIAQRLRETYLKEER